MLNFAADEEMKVSYEKNCIPEVFFTPEALRDIALIVRHSDVEVAFMGSVRNEGNFYIVDKIFLPKQEADSTTCEINPEGLSQLLEDLMDLGEDEAFNRLFFWGHSHVDMKTSPSSQDEKQLYEFAKTCPYYIRGIFNRKAEANLSFLVPGFNITFNNLPVKIWNDFRESEEIEEKWKKELEDKVEKTTTSFSRYTSMYRSNPNKSYSGRKLSKHLQSLGTEEEVWSGDGGWLL